MYRAGPPLPDGRPAPLDLGTLAEVFGPTLLESDRDARKLRMCAEFRRDAYATLPDADRAAFAAYTRGVNYFMSTHLNKLPVEFTF